MDFCVTRRGEREMMFGLATGIKGMRRIAFGAAVLVLSGCMSSLIGRNDRPFTAPEAMLPRGSSVAVMPFENMTGNPNAGDIVAELAATELYRKGAFTVLEPTRVRNQLAQLDSAKERATDIIYASAARKVPQDLKKVGQTLGVAGVLVGTVSEFGYQDALREEPVVGLTVRLVRASDGTVVWASSGTSLGNNWFSRRSVNETAEDVLADVLGRLAMDKPSEKPVETEKK